VRSESAIARGAPTMRASRSCSEAIRSAASRSPSARWASAASERHGTVLGESESVATETSPAASASASASCGRPCASRSRPREARSTFAVTVRRSTSAPAEATIRSASSYAPRSRIASTIAASASTR
jgi:hypothetical protein